MAKQNMEKDELTTYYEHIYSDIEAKTLEDPYGDYILKRVKGGQKTVFNKSQTEIRNFDMSFLDTIESVYPAILKIMRDPKKSIRYEEEIVAVEKARKVNSQTVRHLSSHTQLIKEIKKDGDVIPSKVLTTYAEEELAIYENRFIKSLVKRIEMFLEKRYEVMKVSLESFETQKLNVKNEFLLSGQKVTVDLDIQIKNDLTTNVEATKAQYNRLLYVREMIQGLKGTEFMRALAKARDVLPPIMKTNIILHNPDFKLCYGLWLYLDRVDGISQDVDVKEKSYRYSDIFARDINQCMALALTSFLKNREIEGVYSSRNLPSLKAPKPVVNEDINLELNLNADNKKLEDYTMNQLLLEQTAKFFEASMSGLQRTGNTYNESIRVVYRQMLDMLDQIYPAAFGVYDEQLDSTDLYQQLEFQRRRMMILKIVRQQKQMNIARMAKDEKRIEKQIENVEKKIKAQEEKERIRIEKLRLKEEQQRQAAIEKAKALEEKKRKLEEEAMLKAKAQEERLTAKSKSSKEKSDKQKTIGRELAKKRIDYLRNLKYPQANLSDEEDEVLTDELNDTIATEVDEANVATSEAESVSKLNSNEGESIIDEESTTNEGEPILDEESTTNDEETNFAENSSLETEVIDNDDTLHQDLEDSDNITQQSQEDNDNTIENVAGATDMDATLDSMAEDYEKMLKDSGMTDEEIALLLGIPSKE